MESDCEKKVIEINDEEVLFESDDLKVGMKVGSEVEAYNLCNSYALKKGFSIRKGNIRRDAQRDIRQRDYLCSKEGFYDDIYEVNTVQKLDTRTGCKALIRFTVDDGVWKITHINPNHNHEFAKPEERQFLKSSRKIPKAHANVISSMVDAGIRPTKSYSYMAKEVGGAEHLGFTKKDCQNFLQRKKEEMFEGGDGQSLINYFKHKQAEDPNFFYSVQVDQFNRLTNFFWRDGRSKLDYDCFGDVVCFDTTFRTNKYNLICAPFVGVNHHWKNVLFGCAFLLDESTPSFVWLFETFLEAMGNKQPKSIFTDEDKAMAKAIPIVFPQASHRLCTWHISKKAANQLAGYYANPEFKKHFNKCFYGCSNEAEFQVAWDDMIKKFKLENHSWLNKLYSLRQKWCHIFSLDTFSANFKSTQRSESTNNIFNQISTKTMKLTSFVQQYEHKTEEMRLAELEEDFRCRNGMPHLKAKSGIFKQAASEYTIKMFKRFEKELMGCFEVRMMEVCNNGDEHVYEAIEEDHQRVYMIQFNSTTSKISCSCKLFESMGLLCRHALKVLDTKNFTSIPTQYILKRWTKGAKKGIVVSSDLCESSYKKARSVQSLRLSELMHEVNNVVSIASLCDSGTRVVKQKLGEAMKLLECDMEIAKMMENLNNVGDQNLCDVPLDKSPVLNPPIVRTKGMKNARLKSHLEKRKRKNSRVESSSQISKPTSTMNSGEPNQEIISGLPLSSHTFGHPNFSFTRMLQGNDQVSSLRQDSSRTLSANYIFGESTNFPQDSSFIGLNQFQGFGMLKRP